MTLRVKVNLRVRTKALLHQTKMRICWLNQRALKLFLMIIKCSRLSDKEMMLSINSISTTKMLKSSLTKFLHNSTRSNLRSTSKTRLKKQLMRTRTLSVMLKLTKSLSIWRNLIFSEYHFLNLISWGVLDKTKMKRL